MIPDTFRLDRAGAVLERATGVKKIAIRAAADGGTLDETVAPERVELPCLDDDQLAQLSALAERCDEVYGPARDIEWAFADGQLYLLQCRAVTRTGSSPRPTAQTMSRPGEMIERVPLFANLSPRDVESIAGMFKERRFVAGETITKTAKATSCATASGSGIASGFETTTYSPEVVAMPVLMFAEKPRRCAFSSTRTPSGSPVTLLGPFATTTNSST